MENEFEYILKHILNEMTESVMITTPEIDLPGPKITYVNNGFCNMTGYAPEDVLGKTPRILQGPITNRAVLDRLKDELKETGSFKDGYAVNYKKDGTPFYIEWDITSIKDINDKTIHYLTIQRDVSMLVQQQLEINVLQSRLEDMLENFSKAEERPNATRIGR